MNNVWPRFNVMHEGVKGHQKLVRKHSKGHTHLKISTLRDITWMIYSVCAR